MRNVARRTRRVVRGAFQILTLRGLRKVSGKIFARLGISLGLGGIFGRRRGRRSPGTAGEQGKSAENENELKSRSNRRQSPNKRSGFNLIVHETCRQRNLYNLPPAWRQYEGQIFSLMILLGKLPFAGCALTRCGAPVKIRTSNLLIRSQMLYPVELRVLRGS